MRCKAWPWAQWVITLINCDWNRKEQVWMDYCSWTGLVSTSTPLCSVVQQSFASGQLCRILATVSPTWTMAINTVKSAPANHIWNSKGIDAKLRSSWQKPVWARSTAGHCKGYVETILLIQGLWRLLEQRHLRGPRTAALNGQGHDRRSGWGIDIIFWFRGFFLITLGHGAASIRKRSWSTRFNFNSIQNITSIHFWKCSGNKYQCRMLRCLCDDFSG